MSDWKDCEKMDDICKIAESAIDRAILIKQFLMFYLQ
jgi:hypothetical protein